MAPEFSAKTINGNIIDLKQFQNKSFVLLDFWGSWCFPCRRLTPNLKAIYEKFHDNGFEIISIAINDKEENWKKAIAEDSMQRWQHILDNDTIKNLYSADFVPILYLINREGKVIARYNGGERAYGERPYWELYQDLNELFGKPN
ncbi:TlpA family protein disulfide reductase [Flavisolibacter tropicus]|uniref:TlpA family protein disulfide reductase n=1 Tax=Flavisolibacter tropicus TaxID=1492898 RepID=UPI00082F76DD|nr:TlpA disulfide reductase family protein [Flavisolibacter tropicus]